jgi:hypothetical protein
MPAVVADPDIDRPTDCCGAREVGDFGGGVSLVGEGDEGSGEESGESEGSGRGWSSFESGGEEAMMRCDLPWGISPRWAVTTSL